MIKEATPRHENWTLISVVGSVSISVCAAAWNKIGLSLFVSSVIVNVVNSIMFLYGGFVWLSKGRIAPLYRKSFVVLIAISLWLAAIASILPVVPMIHTGPTHQDPHVSDYISLLSVLTLIAGIAKCPNFSQDGFGGARKLIDSIGSSLFVFLWGWILFFEDIVKNGRLTSLGILWVISVFLVNSIAVGVITFFAWGRIDRLSPTMRWIFAAIGINLVQSVIFFPIALKGDYVQGNWIDVFTTLAAGFMVLSSESMNDDYAAVSEQDKKGAMLGLILLLPVLPAIISAFGMAVFVNFYSSKLSIVSINVGLLIVALLAWREYFSLRDLLGFSYELERRVHVRTQELEQAQEVKLLTEREKAVLHSQAIEAQLQALKMQLQPHFLFNTLNGISALIRDDPRLAEVTILKLSDLLRTTLESPAAQFHPICNEIRFLNQYLEIERIQYPDRVELIFDINEDINDIQIPAFILQPIVENAFKHAVSKNGKVTRIAVRGSALDSRVILSVENDGDCVKEIKRFGLGLSIVRDRLNVLFRDEHVFSINYPTNGGLKVIIELPKLASRGI